MLQLKTASLGCFFFFSPVWKHIEKKIRTLLLSPGLLQLLKTCTPISFSTTLAHVLPHSRPLMLPPALPYTTCHSTADSFIYFLTIPVLLSLAGYTATFPCSFFFFFHLYLLCLFPPKFHSPIICTFSFLCSITLPSNTSLSLISFSYSLSHLSFPLIFPLFAASLHRLLPFAILHFLFFFHFTDPNQTGHCVSVR